MLHHHSEFSATVEAHHLVLRVVLDELNDDVGRDEPSPAGDQDVGRPIARRRLLSSERRADLLRRWLAHWIRRGPSQLCAPRMQALPAAFKHGNRDRRHQSRDVHVQRGRRPRAHGPLEIVEAL